VMLTLGRTVWGQEAEFEGEGHTFLI
jgi:hypothetical protein